MASTLLQLNAVGRVPLACSSSLGLPQNGRIQCSGSAFLIRQGAPRGLSVRGFSRRGRWGAARRTRLGVNPAVVGMSKASAADTTGSVSVENVAEDFSEDGVNPAVVGTSKAIADDTTGSVAVENVAEDVSEDGMNPAIVGTSKASADDTTGGVAVEDVAEDVSEDVSEDASEDVSGYVSEEEQSPEEEEDRQNIQDILRVVDLLRTKRDMTFNEVRLTVMIEDPRDVERRKMLNIEDDRGCSREELGNALAEIKQSVQSFVNYFLQLLSSYYPWTVYEGRVPQDRVTLRELAKEMLNWPNLEDEIALEQRIAPVASPYAKATDTGVDPRLAAQRAKVDWDSAVDILPGEEKKDMNEGLPQAMGFSFLYLISSLPVIIGIVVVAILFLNSLQ